MKLVRTEGTISKQDAAQFVLDELRQCDLFRGKYDAKHGNEHYMYGICTVIENIAYMVSEECHDRIDKEFTQNMIESEAKADASGD